MIPLRTNFPSLARCPVDYSALKANAFADQGIVVASLDDPKLDDFERQFLRNLGRKLFGTDVNP